MVKQVAIIGTGPSGFLTLQALKRLAESGEVEMTAFDKQPHYGGLWNYIDDADKDRWGDNVPGSMYRNLWINSPIEAFELHDMPFSGNIPSLPPREPLTQFVDKYVEANGLDQYMQLNTKVEHVEFDKKLNKFLVKSREYGSEEINTGIFDYVVVCTGHFSTPNEPCFQGEETFPGKILHAHQFRDGAKFKGQRVLAIGGSYSAEDITMQCWKYGARQVTITRGKPMGFHWPEGVEEKPILTEISGSKVTFADGSEAEFDSIIKCTGYLHSFPFLAEELRLVTDNNYHPPLYKQVVFPENTGLFYVGMQDQLYTLSMFYLQGQFIAKVLSGEFQMPGKSKMLEEIARGRARLPGLKNRFDGIDFQTEYINELVKITGAPNYDAAHLFKAWERSKMEDIVNYRARSYKSIFTGRVAPQGPVWTDELDASKLEYTF